MALFKGIYDLIKKSKKTTLSEKILIHKDVSPILSADILLGTEKRQQILSEIRSQLNLPEEEFHRIFQTVTENFAEFVQNLPETERSYYAEAGGMLDHALERASLSLFLCRTYLLSEKETLSSSLESEMVWVYAVYTAALLYDIGKLATTHSIALTDADGNAISAWLPYGGPMTRASASHYSLNFTEASNDRMRWMVNTLLARQVLPEEGFNWLASDSEVFECWLSLLCDEERQIGSLLTVVRLADAELLETFFTDKKIFRHNLSPQKQALMAKLKKDHHQKTGEQKDLRDKMLREYTDKEIYKKALKTGDPSAADLLKIAKQSQTIFSVPSPAQDERLKSPYKHPSANAASRLKTAYAIAETGTTLGKADIKKIMGPLIETLRNNAEKYLGKGIYSSNNSVFIDQKILQQFLDVNKLPVGIEQLKQLLAQMHIANPVELLKQTGQINPAVLILNPFIIFPAGPPPMVPGGELFQVVPSNGANQTEVRPHIPTAQETYELEQKRSEKIDVVQQQFHTPAPTRYPGSHN